MAERVFVVGVGMTDFVKPSARPDWDYPDMVREAGTQALEDAGVTYEQIQHVARRILLRRSRRPASAPSTSSGHTGVPVVNVNNACASRLDRADGGAQCRRGRDGGLCAGHRLREDGPLHAVHRPRLSARSPHGGDGGPPRKQRRAHHRADVRQCGREHMERYGTRAESFARIAVKNHKHSVHNPRAQFRKEFSLEEVMASPALYPPLTLLQAARPRTAPQPRWWRASASCASTAWRPRGRDRRPGHGDRLRRARSPAATSP